MHSRCAAHVRRDMNTLTPTLPTFDAHEKTIDLRVERLREAITHATAIYTSAAPQLGMATRTITVLVENRVLVNAHAQALIETILNTHPADRQDDAIAAQVRPLTLLLESANIATARMRQIIGAHQ